MAVAAAVTGVFSATRAAERLVFSGVGGVLIGLLIGWLVVRLDPQHLTFEHDAIGAGLSPENLRSGVYVVQAFREELLPTRLSAARKQEISRLIRERAMFRSLRRRYAGRTRCAQLFRVLVPDCPR